MDERGGGYTFVVQHGLFLKLCSHGNHLEIWEQFWCYRGKTCWDWECDGMDQEHQTCLGCRVWVFVVFFIFIYRAFVGTFEKCLFFYFFLVYLFV